MDAEIRRLFKKRHGEIHFHMEKYISTGWKLESELLEQFCPAEVSGESEQPDGQMLLKN